MINECKHADIGWKRIYIAEFSNGETKIGISADPEYRLYTLRLQAKSDVVKKYFTKGCSNPYEVEKNIHKQLKNKRLHGEWYSIDFDTGKQYIQDIFHQYAQFKYYIPYYKTKAGREEIHKYLVDSLRR